jgi:hypothetical protein
MNVGVKGKEASAQWSLMPVSPGILNLKETVSAGGAKGNSGVWVCAGHVATMKLIRPVSMTFGVCTSGSFFFCLKALLIRTIHTEWWAYVQVTNQCSPCKAQASMAATPPALNAVPAKPHPHLGWGGSQKEV